MNKEQFLQLVDKYLAGEISAPEEQQLLSYYHSFQQEAAQDKGIAERMEVLEGLLWQNISDKALSEAIAPVVIMRRKRIGYAAAAAMITLLIGAGIYLWMKPSPIAETSEVSNNTQIVPGSEKAILTLADGSTIVLDTTSNGALALQGNSQIVKLSNGQIAYNLNGISDGKVLMNTMATPKGGKYQVVLPDGTKVWLNAASAITYPTAFAPSERNVRVSGEVYFEVAKDQQRPFKVDVDGQLSVLVLGTSFNINSYPDEEAIKTTLLEGSVKVEKENHSILLNPGYQAVVASSNQNSLLKNNDRIKTQSADIEQTMAWKNGVFNFDGLDIRAVMSKIERWYDVEVIYEGEIPSDRLLGKLPMNTSIDRVLNILKKVGVQFRIENKKIIVTK